MSSRIVLHTGLKAALGFLLLQLASTAMAFTLLPQEQLSPSTTITNSSTTVNAQVQPVTNAIRSHLQGARRTHPVGRIAQGNVQLAANSYSTTQTDAPLLLAYNDLAAAGGSGGASGGNTSNSLWIGSSFSQLKNNFSRTRYDGDAQMVVAGFDHTVSDTYILGVALAYQTSTLLTRFNSGDQRSKGYNFTPYFAYLISDALTFDLSLGYGKSSTSQSRAVSDLVGLSLQPLTYSSSFTSTNNFAAANLTHVATRGQWNLTSGLGYLAAKQKQGAYTETPAGSVVATSTSVRQWSLAEEAAYAHQDSESYLGVMYEKMSNPDSFRFASGEQPSSDTDSFLLSIGWRHIGKDLIANFAFSSRLGLANVTENGFSTTIRGDF
jgi:hypothetical protein